MDTTTQTTERMSLPSLLLFGGKRYLQWHLNLINVCYTHLAWRLDGPAFCMLFNFRAAIRGQDIRFRFNATECHYVAESDGLQRRFKSKYAAIGGYSNGLKARAEALGHAYHLDAIPFEDGDVIVDCGANIGDLKLYFDINNRKIRYFAFEPSPEDFACLQPNVAPGFARNAGLWHTSSELTFYISIHNGDSSFIEPAAYTETRQIPVQRLDELMDGNIKLLKIEAEGAEPEVLLGCEKLLANIEYISVDLGYERGIAMESTLVPVTNYLLQNGYELIEVGKARLVALYKNTRHENLSAKS